MPISSSANNIPCDPLRYDWYSASNLDISNYYSCTRTELSRIKLPLEAMQCGLCNKHCRGIDVFYSAIINCLHDCIKQCIPVLKSHNDNSVAGWNDYVSPQYNTCISRTDFKWWVAHNRPRHGPIYHAMRMSRAQFKQKVQLRRAFNYLPHVRIYKKSWVKQFFERNWKTNKAKSALSNCVAGVTGETAITDMCRDHCEELLNSRANSYEK